MSELAGDAKDLADRQEQRRQEILAMTAKVQNASEQALNDANEAIFGVSNSSKQIAELLRNAQEVEQRLRNTQQLALEQAQETNKTHNEAAVVLSSVESVRLPNIVLEKFTTDSVDVQQKAQNVLKAAREMASGQENVFGEAAKMLTEAQQQLRKAQEGQKQLDAIVEQVEAFIFLSPFLLINIFFKNLLSKFAVKFNISCLRIITQPDKEIRNLLCDLFA